MKLFKSINRGLILTLLVLIVVITYVITVSLKASAMEEMSDSCLADFLIKDSEWKVIPAEYRNNEAGYLEKIESEVRTYFENDSAYNYYIDNNISCQFRTGNFCERYSASIYEKYGSTYDNGISQNYYMMYITYRMSNGESVDGDFSYMTFSFAQKDGSVQIHYIQYSLAGMGYGGNYGYYDYGMFAY